MIQFIDERPRNPLLLLGLGMRLVRGQRIRKCTKDGNARSNDGVAFHGFLENNGGDNNNDDTLGGVQYGRGDGTDMARESEGYNGGKETDL